MKDRYQLSTVDLDTLVDPIVLSFLNKIVKKGVAIDEQHKRFSDLVEMLKVQTFTKKQSSMDLKQIRHLAEDITKWIDRIAKRLSKRVSDDAIEQGMALICYRKQLRAALMSRLVLIKAEDDLVKWQEAIRIAVAVGGAVAGTVGFFYLVGKVAKHLKRGEDGKRALEKSQAEIAEEKRNKEEAEQKKREQALSG